VRRDVEVFPSTVENDVTLKGEEVAMRTRMAFLSSAVVAAGLLAATVAVAATPVPPPDLPPLSCTAGGVTISTVGPTLGHDCVQSSTSQCTEIQYTISSAPANCNHVVVLEGLGVAYVKNLQDQIVGGNQIFPACQGDNLTGLGARACHEQAVRIDSNPEKSAGFTVGLVGTRKPSPTTIAVRIGSQVSACRILGVGLEAGAGPDDVVATKKYETFGACTLVETIPLSGPVIVEVSEDSDPDCHLLDENGTDLKDVTLTVGTHVGTGLQAQAFNFVTKGSKCYSTVIPTPNGKLYTVCK
jgi:hypothetical protein